VNFVFLFFYPEHKQSKTCCSEALWNNRAIDGYKPFAVLKLTVLGWATLIVMDKFRH
jgi:hypothetical protein